MPLPPVPLASTAATVASTTDTVAAAGPSAGEASLVARAKTGDREAFGLLVQATERSVRAICRSMVDNDDDADDIAQEAYIKAWRALASFDTRRPFAPWMHRIAATTAIDAARRRGRRPRLVAIDAVAEPATPHAPASDRIWLDQARSCVAAALGALGTEVALLYHWRYVEELSVEEIAARTGRRPNTVAVALHRLRDAVRRQLQRQGDIDP